MQYNSMSATRGLGMLRLSLSHTVSFYVCAPFPFSAHPSFFLQEACAVLVEFCGIHTNHKQFIFTTVNLYNTTESLQT